MRVTSILFLLFLASCTGNRLDVRVNKISVPKPQEIDCKIDFVKIKTDIDFNDKIQVNTMLRSLSINLHQIRLCYNTEIANKEELIKYYNNVLLAMNIN